MKSSDTQARNIFSRLISYTVQEGGQKPLENFCTETLAWCLKISPKFQKSFLNLIKSKLMERSKEVFLQSLDQLRLEIDTQFAFRDEEESKEGGFFDLVIYSSNFVLVVEVKFYAGFEDTQIARYRRELDSGESFPDRAGKFLVTLTRQIVPQKFAKDLDASIYWPQVLDALNKTVSEAGVSSPNDGRSSAEDFMLAQFASFLKEKRVTPMKINPINQGDLESWTNFVRFQAESLQILERFRDELKDIWKPKKIEYGNNENVPWFWWGVYSKIHGDDWCGFVFYYGKKQPELVVQIEGSFLKKIKKDQIVSLFGDALKKANQQGFIELDSKAPDRTWFVCRQPINSDLNGNADAIFSWLAAAAKEFSILRKKLS